MRAQKVGTQLSAFHWEEVSDGFVETEREKKRERGRERGRERERQKGRERERKREGERGERESS